MSPEYLDGKLFQATLKEAVAELREKRENLNLINVFPVPDGDTGNNMLATLESALLEAENTASSSLSEVIDAAYRGARDGSNGNSGAIFAQYLRGWAAAFSGLDKAGARELTLALSLGTLRAYKAVLKPVEGTILTVARAAADAAEKTSASGNMAKTLQALYYRARGTLAQTGRMLPALGSKKMVDAGGWGLLIFFSALLKVMNIEVGMADFIFKPRLNYFKSLSSFEFSNPYDMEFTVHIRSRDDQEIRALLQELGSDLITQTSRGNCHVHVHTFNPLQLVEQVAALGLLSGIVIRNMRSQYDDLLDDDNDIKRSSFIAFGKSPGFLALYAMAGAKVAMSIDAIVKKSHIISEYFAKDNIFLSPEDIALPVQNGSLIVLGEELRVLASLIAVSTSEKPTPEEVAKAAGYPRIATLDHRDSLVDAGEEVLPVNRDHFKTSLFRAVSNLKPQQGEVLTLYYGKAISRRILERYLPVLKEEFPCLENLELYFGGQDLPLILSVE